VLAEIVINSLAGCKNMAAAAAAFMTALTKAPRLIGDQPAPRLNDHATLVANKTTRSFGF